MKKQSSKPAGYSGTPLVQKLGIKPSCRAAFLNAPDGFAKTLGPLPEGIKPLTSIRKNKDLDFILFFTKSRTQLEKTLPQLGKAIQQAGMIWVAWPKKSSAVVTDLDENIIRDTGLAIDLVDVKVCAIDATWSGLKFVIPVKQRPTK
jgi:hypothetical protein